MMTVREASLYCVYNLGGMVMTVSEASLYCVYNPRWDGDGCEGCVNLLCVQP